MILKTFSILDIKTEAYSRPFFTHTTSEALRTFTDAVNDPASPFSKHPLDYILFEVGTWNDHLGISESITPINLGNAAEYQDRDRSIYHPETGALIAGNSPPVHVVKTEDDEHGTTNLEIGRTG